MNKLKDEFVKMLSEQQKQLEHLEKKNGKLEEKLCKIEMQVTELASHTEKKMAEEFTCKLASLEQKYEKEIADLKQQLKETFNAKRLCNPVANRLQKSYMSYMKATVLIDGFRVRNDTDNCVHVFSEKAFVISCKKCPLSDFLKNAMYYFEITKKSSDLGRLFVGLSNGSITDNSVVGSSPNSYGIMDGTDSYRLNGNAHRFDWSNGGVKPEWNGMGDVIGCGILMDANNELDIFFTLNGILRGKQIPISISTDFLYPTVSMYSKVDVEVNFGNNLTYPFKFNIDECRGLIFDLSKE